MDLLNNKIVQFLLVIAVLIILQNLPFMTDVSDEIAAAVTALVGMTSLVAIVWVFSGGALGTKK